jgi:hypothetical protein
MAWRDMTFLQRVFGYVIGRVLVQHAVLPAYFRGTSSPPTSCCNGGSVSVKNLSALIF